MSTTDSHYSFNLIVILLRSVAIQLACNPIFIRLLKQSGLLPFGFDTLRTDKILKFF